MIFPQKATPEAAKHFHDSKLVFAVSVASGRIVHNVLRFTLTTYDSAAGITAPEIPVNHDRRDSIAVIEVIASKKSRNDSGGSCFYKLPELRVFAISHLAPA